MVLENARRTWLIHLADELSFYANEVLGVVDEAELFSGPRGSINMEAQSRIMQQIWEHPDVIGRFLRERADILSKRDRREVSTWVKGALPGMFAACYLPDGRFALLRGGYAFVVQGISREIDTMLMDVPHYLKTIILPFDGAITYLLTIEDMPIKLGPGALKAIEDELDKALAAGNVISTAKGLVMHAQEIIAAEEEEDRELKKQRAADAEAASVPAPGFHRGVLAGLTGEERAKAVREHELANDLDDDDFDPFDPVYMMDLRSRRGTPKFSAKELLGSMKKRELDYVVHDLAIEGMRGLRKAELVDALVPALQDPETLFSLAEPIEVGFLDGVKRVVDAGGRLVLREDEVTSLEGLSPAYEPLLFLFHSKGRFTFVVPDEFVEPARGLDWEELRRRAILRRDIGKLGAAAVELRGIVPLYEFLLDCHDMHPEVEADKEIVGYTLEAAMQSPFYDVLLTSDDAYLLDHDLAKDYLAEEGYEDDGLAVILGELDDVLLDVLDFQDGKDRRPIDAEVLSYPFAALWRLTLPEVDGLRAFLDANVPDNADDYDFADMILLQFVDIAKRGVVGVESIHEYLNALKDFKCVFDSAHLQAFLDCLNPFLANQPCWPNNGWSPLEVGEHMDEGLAEDMDFTAVLDGGWVE